jgi:tetratricopeptide (TPR) repeat protein
MIACGLVLALWWWASGRSSPGGDGRPALSPGGPAASEGPRQSAPEAEPESPRPSESPEGRLLPTPEPQVMPVATCPLEDHGSGPAPSTETVSPSWYTRASDYEQARAEQRSTGRPMVVYVYTDWCPHCREFDRELLSALAVDRYLTGRAVKVRINPESGPEERRLAHTLGVERFPEFAMAVPGRSPQTLRLRERGEWVRPDALVEQIERRMADWAAAVVAAAAAERRAGGRGLDEIAPLLTLAIAARPDDMQGYLERARVLAALRKIDAALDDLARLDRASPGQVIIYQTLDELLVPEGRVDEVIACWSRLIDFSGGRSAEAQTARSRALRRRGLDQLARADAERACQLGAQEACSATPAQ